MSKLLVLIGLPASGKSTFAMKLANKKDAVIVSSDEMRVELFGDVDNQDNNAELFDKVHERINKLLSEGENVIYDATNINRKRRVHLIDNVIKADEYHAYYMNTDFSHCLHSDDNRDKRVGIDVVNKMYKNMNIPTLLEGWDNIEFINIENRRNSQYKPSFETVLWNRYKHDELFRKLTDIIPEFDEILDVPQDSSYHSFSISRHTYHAYKYVVDNYTGDRELEMRIAVLFHDLWKGYCKSFYNFKGEEKRYASYISHELVSSQIAAVKLKSLGYGDDFIKYVVDLVQFHMMPMNMSEKTEKRLRGLLTEEQYNDLVFLHEADLSAK